MNQTTISAKNLRLNLKEILLQASRGHSFTVIYNSEPVAELNPISSKFQKEDPHFWDILDEIKGSGTLREPYKDKYKEAKRLRLVKKYGL